MIQNCEYLITAHQFEKMQSLGISMLQIYNMLDRSSEEEVLAYIRTSVSSNQDYDFDAGPMIVDK